MGNESTTVVNHYQYEDLEKIRRESDERKQKMLLDQKITEYNFQCHRKEIERLVKLDEYNYQKEIQKLKNEEKKNEQLHIERMKDLTNNENKINLDFRQKIRKYDEKEINILKENNNIFLEKEKIKNDFKIQHMKALNEELDITEKRRNERLRDNEINKINLDYNHKCNMEEIKRKSKKDNMEDQRLRRQMDNEKEINLKKINISTIIVLKIKLIYLVKIYKTQIMIKWNIFINYKDLIFVNTI